MIYFSSNFFTLEVFYSIIYLLLNIKNFYITNLKIILSFLYSNTLLKILHTTLTPSQTTIITFLQEFDIIKNTFSLSQTCLNIINTLLLYTSPITSIDYFLIWIQHEYILFKIYLKYFNITTYKFIKNFYTPFPYLIKPYSLTKLYNIIILGRKYEIKTIYTTLINKYKSHIILIGDKGIGKFTILKGLYITIKSNTQKTNYGGGETHMIEFFIINMNKLNTYLLQNTLMILKHTLFTWLKQQYYSILLINNIESNYILNTGESFNILKVSLPIIREQNLKFIGTSTITQSKLIKQDYKDLTFYFDYYPISELNYPEIYNILKFKMLDYINYSKISINPILLPSIINLSNQYITTIKPPLNSLTLLSYSYLYTLQKNTITTITLSYIYTSISLLTKIPYSLLTKNLQNKNLIKQLETNIKKIIFGQPQIINKIIYSLQRSLLGIKDLNKPLGSWILCGPSGTGKTELAKTLTTTLFNTKENLIRCDMSEFMEKHSVSKLIGSPPGYVGYGDPGILTTALLKNPYNVLLFDEIEKAHIDITNIMLQILDDGRLTNSMGQVLNFTKTIILFTSNLGCPTTEDFYNDKKGGSVDKLQDEIIIKSIKKYFKPEFLNRLDDILIFQPLSIPILIRIIDKTLTQLKLRLQEQQFNISIILSIELKYMLSKLGYSPLYGARPIMNLINDLIINPLIDIILKLNLPKTPFITYFKLNLKTQKIILNIIPNK